MARRLDKEIWNMVAEGEFERPIKMANEAGYHVEVYDGDVETGMLSPVITHMSRKPLPKPDIIYPHHFG